MEISLSAFVPEKLVSPGHAIAYIWRSLPRVRRHGASKPQGSSERVLPWQVTMDQFICASLSHTHYWYEVGMLKAPTGQLLVVVNTVLFLTFSVLVTNPKKTTLHAAGQSRSWSAEQGKKKSKKVWQRPPPPPPPPTLLVWRKKKKKHATHLRRGATQVSVCLASYKDFFDLSARPMGVASQKFYAASVCDNNFPSLVASLFFRRCLAASTSSFLQAAMNLRPPCKLGK